MLVNTFCAIHAAVAVVVEVSVPWAEAWILPTPDWVSVEVGVEPDASVTEMAEACPEPEPVAVDVAVPDVFAVLLASAVAPPIAVAVEVAVAPAPEWDSARAPTPVAVAFEVPSMTTTAPPACPTAIAEKQVLS